MRANRKKCLITVSIEELVQFPFTFAHKIAQGAARRRRNKTKKARFYFCDKNDPFLSYLINKICLSYLVKTLYIKASLRIENIDGLLWKQHILQHTYLQFRMIRTFDKFPRLCKTFH